MQEEGIPSIALIRCPPQSFDPLTMHLVRAEPILNCSYFRKRNREHSGVLYRDSGAGWETGD